LVEVHAFLTIIIVPFCPVKTVKRWGFIISRDYVSIRKMKITEGYSTVTIPFTNPRSGRNYTDTLKKGK